MAQAFAPIPRATTETYAKWLADQEFTYDTDGHFAWVLNKQDSYLVEGVIKDSEGKCLSYEEMQQAMELMQHAPQLLRAVLRGLEVLDNGTLNDSTKAEQVQQQLAEVASSCLRGQGEPLDVARALQAWRE